MTKDEALKLALEAMRFALHVGFDESSESQIKKGDKAVQQHQNAITAIREALAQPEQETVLPGGGHVPAVPVAVYGYCPECGGAGVMRERRPNGDDKCTNGHKYPSSKALAEQPAQQQYQSTADKCQLTPVPAKGGLLPAQQQKPVAWRAWFDADHGARWLFSLWPEEERLDVQWEPLYTTPPKAQPEQEPVAYVTGYFGGNALVMPTNSAMVLKNGTALYTRDQI